MMTEDVFFMHSEMASTNGGIIMSIMAKGNGAFAEVMHQDIP